MRYCASIVSAGSLDAFDSHEAVEEALSSVDSVDLDKMFFAVQYVLGGPPNYEGGVAPSPLWAGSELPVEFGFGPALFVESAMVAGFAGEFGGLTPADLAGRVDLDVLRGDSVYPDVWDEDPVSLTSEIVGAATLLIGLYQKAAAQGDALLTATL